MKHIWQPLGLESCMCAACGFIDLSPPEETECSGKRWGEPDTINKETNKEAS